VLCVPAEADALQAEPSDAAASAALAFPARLAALDSLARLLSSCWRSAADPAEAKSAATHEQVGAPTCTTPSPTHTHTHARVPLPRFVACLAWAQFDTALGEEAAGLLATVASKVAALLLSDHAPSLAAVLRHDGDSGGGGSGAGDVAERYALFAHATVACCHALLTNEFTAVAVAEAGGLTTLAALVRQEPPLPPRLLASVAAALALAVRHSSLTAPLIEPPPEVYEEDEQSGAVHAAGVSLYQVRHGALCDPSDDH